MKPKKSIIVLGFCIVVFCFLGCSLPKKKDAFENAPDRNSLRNEFYKKGEILVVYGAFDTLLKAKYQNVLEELSKTPQRNSWRSLKVKYKSSDAVTQDDLHDRIVLLVGTVTGNKVLQRFIQHTFFQVDESLIHIGAKHFSGAHTTLSVGMYPNPLNPKLPFAFITGIRADEVYNSFAKKVADRGVSFFRQNLDYEITKEGMRLVMGNFSDSWQLDTTDTFFDFSKGNSVLMNTPKVTVYDHQTNLASADKEVLVNNMQKGRAAITSFLQLEPSRVKSKIHFYENTEEKGLITGNTQQGHIDTVQNEVHSIANEIYGLHENGKENALLLYQTVGFSKKDILTYGLPIYFTESWQVQGYKYWAARLRESGFKVKLSQLFDNDYVSLESSLVRDCFSAALVDFLIKTYGKEKFLKYYSTVGWSSLDIASLEKKWQNYLVELTEEFPKRYRKKNKLSYLKGFNFAHEGYDIYNGYGSTKAVEALQKQKNMGSNAMAIVPYSYINDVHTPAAFPISNRAGSENDEAVVSSIFEAKKMGMYSLLKPQIYVPGSWPGAIDMASTEDWTLFFEHYYRWIRHYALLAEIHNVDGLCIGTEFTNASLKYPDQWRKMIQKIRKLYSGHITYAANWGSEFENIEFWDEVDYIGLNSYYPLSKKDKPSFEELRTSFDTIKSKILRVHKKYKKPIVFTEIGFRSTNYPWKNPHAEADDTINELAQQLCYKVVFKGIENEPWCQGILWWKFPSYLAYRGKENNAFTPNNKLAEQTVRKWFSR